MYRICLTNFRTRPIRSVTNMAISKFPNKIVIKTGFFHYDFVGKETVGDYVES